MKNVIVNLLAVGVVLGLFFGYINNFVRFVKSDFKPPAKREIVRGLGILVPPMGVIVGYVNINE